MNILEQARKQAEEHRQKSYLESIAKREKAQTLLNFFEQHQDLNKEILKDYIARIDKELKKLSKIDRGAL
jgi:hypothetical protein